MKNITIIVLVMLMSICTPALSQLTIGTYEIGTNLEVSTTHNANKVEFIIDTNHSDTMSDDHMHMITRSSEGDIISEYEWLITEVKHTPKANEFRVEDENGKWILITFFTTGSKLVSIEFVDVYILYTGNLKY